MIKNLEKKASAAKNLVPEYLKEVKQEGRNLAFVGSMGSHLGTVMLPVITPHPRGHWKENDYYCAYDWVVYAHKTYACKESHVAEDFEKQHRCWVIVIDPK